MCKTSGKMHMCDVVKIDTIVFEIVASRVSNIPDHIGLTYYKQMAKRDWQWLTELNVFTEKLMSFQLKK